METVWADCPECRKSTRCDIVHAKKMRHADEDSGVELRVSHNLLQCRGCETVFYQEDSVFSEDYSYVEGPDGQMNVEMEHKYKYFPAPTRREMLEWAPELNAFDLVLADFYDELYVALNSNLLVLSTIGVRTVLDRCYDILKVNGNTFDEKLVELHSQGYVGQTEKDLLSIVTEAGNAAAHRAWKPTVQQLDSLVDVLNQFLHRTFVLRHDLQPVKGTIPPRPPRQKKVNPSQP